ncbi:hypothetical protein ACSV5K_24475 [Agrobacterium pusense]|uniref:hypothetical protein n=1 Tax=Agrobacterium pusense TaxID=648995 RepID=UPI003FCFE497
MSESNDRGFELLVAAYIDARTAWQATSEPNGDLISEGTTFEALESASLALLRYQCFTLEVIRREITVILASPDLYAMVREDEYEAGGVLRVFLSSLVPR